MKKLVNLFSLLLLMTGLIGFAQNTVSGVVSDADGMPLPGALLLYKEHQLVLPQILMVTTQLVPQKVMF